jgi:glycosyltransferase involved in cell wall biosynthesis
VNQLRRTWRMFRKQGGRVVIHKVLKRLLPAEPLPQTLVRFEDALSVDWRAPHPSVQNPRSLPQGVLTIAWVMSPPGTNSGGHQNIFRFIRFLEDAGHEVRIYLYSAITPDTPAEVRKRVAGSSSYPSLRASIDNYPRGGVPDDVDVIFATGWETAYCSYRDASDARRFYFVQDFEPLFYPTSSESVLAENTYRFGFTGITAGGWLAGKLRSDYGMSTSAFEFGAEHGNYQMLNKSRRTAVFFYARPETPRRGFELGIMALALLSKARPEVNIILAGQDLHKTAVPFRHESPGNLQVGELNEIYNRCAAGLVLSLSNMSLLPLELLSAGVIPVVNDGDNNRLVSDNPFIEYTEPIPQALCDRLIAILDREDQADHAARAAASVSTSTWEKAGEQFLDAVERGLRG